MIDMKYFLKAIRLSLKYRWSAIASLVNAILIGLLWSISISAVYPILEVVFSGHTIVGWVDQKIEQKKESLSDFEDQLQKIKLEEVNADEREVHQSKITLLEGEVSRETSQIDWYLSVRNHVAPYAPATPFSTLFCLMGALVGLTILKGICIISQAYLVARISHGTVRDLRRMFFRSILHFDQAKLDGIGTTQLMTQLSHNINLLGAGLKSLYCQSLREPLKMIACVIGAMLICWRLFLVTMVVVPVGALALTWITHRVKNAARGHMGGISSIMKTLSETISGVKIVKIFNRERTELKRFKKNSDSLYGLSMKMDLYDSILNPLTELIGIVALSIAIVSGGWVVLNQQTHLLGIQISTSPLTPSTLFLFFGFLAGASGPARKLSGIYTSLVRGVMASKALFTMFEQEPKVINRSPNNQSLPLHSKSIRLDNLCFAYRPMNRILHNINLEIPFGQSIAFIGHNGCGKSTLMNLIARYYDPVDGDIYLDDINLKDINPRNLRRQFSMVTQDPFLFDGTIEQNIAYGDSEATEAQIRKAADIAMVTDFVGNLSDGWGTNIGDSGKLLSGGQRQRIAIARAIVGEPRIVILDEATSQIDPATEVQLHARLKEFLSNKTVLIITHRTSTLELADRVITMDSGRVLQDLPADEYRKKFLQNKKNTKGGKQNKGHENPPNRAA